MTDIFSEALQTPSETPEATPAQTPSPETPAQVATDAGKQIPSTPSTAPTTEPQTPSAPPTEVKTPTVEELQAQLAKAEADRAHWQTQYQSKIAKEHEQKMRRSLQQTQAQSAETDEEFDGRVSTLQAKIADGVSQALQQQQLNAASESAAAEIAAVAKEHELPDENLSGVYDLLHRYRLDKPTVIKDESTGLEQLYNPTSIVENAQIHKMLIRGMAAERAIVKAKEAGYAEGYAARDKQMKTIQAPTAASAPDNVAVSPEQAREDAFWRQVRSGETGGAGVSLG